MVMDEICINTNVTTPTNEIKTSPVKHMSHSSTTSSTPATSSPGGPLVAYDSDESVDGQDAQDIDNDTEVVSKESKPTTTESESDSGEKLPVTGEQETISMEEKDDKVRVEQEEPMETEDLGETEEEHRDDETRAKSSPVKKLFRSARKRKPTQAFTFDFPRVKEFDVVPGRGISLFDIPSIVTQITNITKRDEPLIRQIYFMLYGRRHTRSRAEEIKIEILQFSGLHDDALVEVEAQMSGLEPDFIYGMMDLFYIDYTKHHTKKELIKKLMSWLACPTAPTSPTSRLEHKTPRSSSKTTKARTPKLPKKRTSSSSQNSKTTSATKKRKKDVTAPPLIGDSATENEDHESADELEILARSREKQLVNVVRNSIPQEDQLRVIITDILDRDEWKEVAVKKVLEELIEEFGKEMDDTIQRLKIRTMVLDIL